MGKKITERNLKLQTMDATLPANVHGISFMNNEDDFTLLVNRTDPEDRQALSFLHECLHIWHKDHSKQGIDVKALEQERHEELIRLLRLAAG